MKRSDTSNIKRLLCFLCLIPILFLGFGTDVNAQVTETFQNAGEDEQAPNSYLDREWTGDAGGTWTSTDSRIGGVEISGFDGAVAIRNDGAITAPSYSGGISSLTITTQRFFAGGSGTLPIIVNGDVVGSVPYSDQAQTTTLTGLNIEGDVQVTIGSPSRDEDSRDRVSVGEISWTAAGDDSGSLLASPNSLSGLSYMFGDGPSVSESFDLSGSSLDGSNVVITAPFDFEVSLSETTGFGSSVSLNSFDGSETAVFVRLGSGLTEGDYEGDVAISGGGVDEIEVEVAGTVGELFALPYANEFRSQEAYDLAIAQGFNITSDDLRTAAGGYLLLEVGEFVESPSIDFTALDAINVEFDITTFGGGSDRVFTLFVSNDDGASYTEVQTADVTGDYVTFSATVDLSGGNNTTTGKLKMEMTGGTAGGTRFRDLSLADATPPDLSAPVFSLDAGTYFEDQTVFVSNFEDFEAGTEVFYTVDGSTPDNSSELYNNGTGISLEDGNGAITLKAFAVSGELESPVSERLYGFPLNVADIEALRASPTGSTVYRVTNEATFIGGTSFRNTKFFQDDSGYGIQIDDGGGTVETTYEIGDNVAALVGSMSAFQGQLQFSPSMDFGAPVSSGNTVEPMERTLESLSADDQSRLTVILDVEFENAGSEFGGGGFNTNITDPSLEGFTGLYRNIFGDSDITGTVIPEGSGDVTGIMQQNNAGFNIGARNLADLVFEVEEDVVATPVFDPAAGSFTDEVTVAITTATADAAIYFTTDGSEPTEESTLYEEALTFTETTTLKARAYFGDFTPSNVRTGEYQISDELVITTIAQLQEQLGAGDVTFSGEAVITYQQGFRNQKYMQDDTGGILIDDSSGTITTDYEVGDVVSNFSGSVGEFGNMLQFVPSSDPGAPVDTGVEVEPIVLTLEALYDDFGTYRARVVTVEGMVFSEPGANFANGQVYAIEDMDAPSITGEFRTTFFDVDYIGTEIPSAPLNVTGIPNSRSEGDFVTARNQADIEVFSSDEQVAAPTVEPASGLYTEAVEVTMSVDDDQASIYYTLDGNDPAESSTLYSGAFNVTETTNVRARAFRAGFEPSAVVSRNYNFPMDVDNLADARELELGTAVRLTGLVTTPDFGFNAAEFYIQDEVGGLKVRWPGFGGGNTDTPFAEGQVVELVGTLDERFGELLIAPAEFEIISSNNELPEAVAIDDYETLWSADSAEQGRRVTILEVSLVDPDAWPTEPIPGGSGLTVQAVDADGNIYDIRIDRDESEFEASPVPPAVFNLSGVLGQFEDNAQMFPFFLFELEEVLEAPRAQIIHNAADPALAMVDVYVNGEILFAEVAFRGASPFFETPANEEFTVSLTAAGDDLENAVYEAEVTLDAGETYYMIAQGVLDPGAFSPNPDGIDIGFELDIIEGARETPEEMGNVEFAIYHGVTDAPTADIVARDVATLAEGLSYTDITDTYISISADGYTLDINVAGTTLISFNADLGDLAGQTALVLASGFLDASQGEALGALVVLADGTSLMLEIVTSIDNGNNEIPLEFALNQNYPNPFNPTTNISYALPEAVNVSVEVYNITGQRVATLVNGQQSAGFHTVTFDANRLSSGVYLYRIQAGNYSETRKMMLVK